MVNDQGRHVHALAFSAGGKTAATGAKDGSIRVWDLEKRGQSQPGGDWFLFEKKVGVGDIGADKAHGCVLLCSTGRGAAD